MEFLKAMLAEMNAKMDATREKMDAETKAVRDRMEANMNAWREETMSCQVMTEACLGSKELNPEEMESESEHREVPTEEAAGKSAGTMKKRHRGRHLDAGRLVEPKELTRGDCGSRRKLAATCRKVSRRAAVARRKGNIYRKILTHGNCGPRKELAAAGRKITRCAKVARHKGHGLQEHSHDGLSVEQGLRKNETRNKFARGTRKGRTLGRRQLMRQEGTNGTRNRDIEEQLRLGSETTTSEFDRKTFGLEFVKQATRMPSGLQRMRNWTLRRGRPPPKRKKMLHTE
jgi:hypothetical protein